MQDKISKVNQGVAIIESGVKILLDIDKVLSSQEFVYLKKKAA
jgi:hypothetical protein